MVLRTQSLAIAAVALSLGGMACTASGTPRSAAPDSTPIEPSVAANDTSEAGALAASAGVATRAGITLTIRTASGVVVLADDSSDQSEAYRIHRYAGKVPGVPFHAVHVSYFESGGYLLVHDSTGRKVTLDAAPVISPNGRRMAVGSFDLEAQMSPNVVKILERVGDSATVVFAVEPTDWGPDSLRWVGDDTLALIRLVSTTRGPGDYDRHPARLVRRGPAWSFLDAR